MSTDKIQKRAAAQRICAAAPVPGSVIPGSDLFLQLAVVHLANGGHRHFADELVAHRLHVLRQLFLAQLAQLAHDLALLFVGLRVQHHVDEGQAALHMVLIVQPTTEH